MRGSHFIAPLIIAASISTLVVVFQHRSSSQKCSLDGIRIDPLYEVNIIQEGETSYRFSCVLSAQLWLKGNSEPISAIWVTDETTGEKIRAELAYYVESNVITTPHIGNRVHAFSHEKAAELHAKQYKGKLVKNPLKVRPLRRVKLVEYTPYSPDNTGLTLPSSQKPLSLSSNPVLIVSLNLPFVSKRSFNQLCRGYSSPPDKPPKTFS
ncbi:MAG: hypothetical protein PVH02_02170 [Desulfobacteraceae bacterium]